MLCGPAIYAQLFANAPVNAAVGGRIVPQIAAEGAAYPRIVYSGDAAQLESAFDGSECVATQTVRINAEAATYAAAVDLAQKVFAALHDQSGAWGGLKILGCFFEDEDEAIDEMPGMGPDAPVYVVMQTYTLCFVPTN